MRCMARRARARSKVLSIQRHNQIFRFFNEVSVRYVDEEEVKIFDPGLRSFLNINSPEGLNDFDNLS